MNFDKLHEALIDEASNRIVNLEQELLQQRFNNKHNLSIDQQVADKITTLEDDLEDANETIKDQDRRLIKFVNYKNELEAEIEILKSRVVTLEQHLGFLLDK